MTAKEALAERNLPALLTREEMLDIMQREVYGYLPTTPCEVIASEPTRVENRYNRFTVTSSYVNLTLRFENGEHTFRVDRLFHNDNTPRPLIVLLNFHPMGASHYFAIEELSEREVNFLVINYRDVTSDDADMTNGLAALLLPNGQDTPTAPGKIAIWAYAAMRVLDYGLTLPGVDKNALCIAGHSRLGKTALFTAAMDTRFRFALVNNSGCGGDALAHGNTGHTRKKDEPKYWEYGELYSNMLKNFPYWGCKNFLRHTERDLSDEFDQHFLLAAVAPRYSFHVAAELDLWADPVSQYLCTVAASPAWESEGLVGMTDADTLPVPDEVRSEGHIGFFYAPSAHFLSRHNWCHFIDFVEKHK